MAHVNNLFVPVSEKLGGHLPIPTFKENLVTIKQVKDWMTSHVITVSSSCTLPDAYWLMLENKIRRLPVVEESNLVGMVTIEDLRHMDPVKVAGFDVIHISNMLSMLPVRQLMTKNPITIAPTASLIDAARLMLKHKISALPVLEGDKLVGIITESDIFRAFVESEEKN
jgi:acetoin utilization protein AcuB